MATTKPKSPVVPAAAEETRSARPNSRPRRRWPWLIPLALLLLLGWYWTPLIGMARTGASFGARVACSCRYVAGRSLEDCRNDFEPGMSMIMLSEDTTAKTVTARFPLLASQTATWRDGPGCVLEPWDN